MTVEYFDLYDQAARPLGRRKTRSDVHRDGDWHRSVALWVVRRAGTLVLQRRSRSKDTHPGLFTASVSGHFAAGEGLDEVLREAREEVGVPVSAAELEPVGLWRFDERPGPGLIDRELQDVFLWPCELPLAAFTPDPREVQGLAELPIAEFLSLVEGGLAGVVALWLEAGSLTVHQILLQSTDLVPEPEYHALVGRAAQVYLRHDDRPRRYGGAIRG